jgi:hypothetical protein
MPLPRELLHEMAAKRAIETREAERDKLHDYLRSAGVCFFWSLLGCACIMWSAHTTDMILGRIAFFGGLAMGNGGILFTLMGVYRRGEKRGDW